MKGLLAIHVNCTAPQLLSGMDTYQIEDFELLSTMLSALQWKRLGGVIGMVTDTVGAQYYRALGLDALYNGGIDDTLHYDVTGIDPVGLWAAGKLFALARLHAPCVMLDTDFILWEDVYDLLASAPLVVAHRESLDESIYPPSSHFPMKEGYHFPAQWDWQARPCNTAFAYFGDEALRLDYTQQAIAFMRGLAYCPDTLTAMVFAEQRLLAMCAQAKGAQIGTLFHEEQLFEQQSRATHLWGFKQQMRDNPRAREAFCRRCEERIRRDFPESAYLLERIGGADFVT